MKNPVKIPAARILKESGLKVPAHLKRDMLALIDKISDDREPLEIVLLLPPEKRVSVAGHHEFREGLRGSTDDDDLQADPILDHAPSVRSKVDADRLLSILDELAKEDSQ